MVSVYRRIELFLTLTACLLTPLLFCAITAVATDQPASGNRFWAQVVVTMFALFFVGAPFFIQHVFLGAGASHIRARGREPREFILNVAITSSAVPSFIGFYYTMTGGPDAVVYLTSILAVSSILFWVWRYRTVVSHRGSSA